MSSHLVSQADSVLSTTALRYIGALRTYAARLNFFLGVPNTLMIGVLFYNDSAAIQSIFPTVYHWVAFIGFVVVPSAILSDRVLLHPAQIAYNAHQNSRANRNPTYRLVKENNRRLGELQDSSGVAACSIQGGSDDPETSAQGEDSVRTSTDGD